MCVSVSEKKKPKLKSSWNGRRRLFDIFEFPRFHKLETYFETKKKRKKERKVGKRKTIGIPLTIVIYWRRQRRVTVVEGGSYCVGWRPTEIFHRGNVKH